MQAREVLQNAKQVLQGMLGHQSRALATPDPGHAKPDSAATVLQAITAGPQPASAEWQETKPKQSLTDGPGPAAPGASGFKEHEACIVCMEAEVQVVFRPCGHAVACQACSALVSATSNDCPVCRCPVQTRHDFCLFLHASLTRGLPMHRRSVCLPESGMTGCVQIHGKTGAHVISVLASLAFVSKTSLGTLISSAGIVWPSHFEYQHLIADICVRAQR